jgi:hypothetical protein
MHTHARTHARKNTHTVCEEEEGEQAGGGVKPSKRQHTQSARKRALKQRHSSSSSSILHVPAAWDASPARIHRAIHPRLRILCSPPATVARPLPLLRVHPSPRVSENASSGDRTTYTLQDCEAGKNRHHGSEKAVCRARRTVISTASGSIVGVRGLRVLAVVRHRLCIRNNDFFVVMLVVDRICVGHRLKPALTPAHLQTSCSLVPPKCPA